MSMIEISEILLVDAHQTVATLFIYYDQLIIYLVRMLFLTQKEIE
jgi:hypothetical protein